MNSGSIWITLSIFSPFIPLLLSGWRWKRMHRWHRLLLGLIVAELIFELTGRWMANTFGNNMPLMHGYILLEALVIIQLFRPALSRFLGKNTLTLISISFFIVVLLNGFFVQAFTEYANISRLEQSILLIIIASLWFYQVFKEQRIMELEKSFLFWMSIAVLFYFSSNVVLWALGDMSGDYPVDYFAQVWVIHAFSNILLHIIYTIALWTKY